MVLQFFYHMQKYIMVLFINSDPFEVLEHTDFKMWTKVKRKERWRGQFTKAILAFAFHGLWKHFTEEWKLEM